MMAGYIFPVIVISNYGICQGICLARWPEKCPPDLYSRKTNDKWK
jgi:hypothetical protein